MSTQCASPSGRVLLDVRDADPELRAVADGGLDLRVRVTDDDPHLGDAGVTDGLQAVEQHRLLATGTSCLALVWGDRTQTGPAPPDSTRAFMPGRLALPGPPRTCESIGCRSR
jgi:hypothetical protein